MRETIHHFSYSLLQQRDAKHFSQCGAAEDLNVTNKYKQRGDNIGLAWIITLINKIFSDKRCVVTVC